VFFSLLATHWAGKFRGHARSLDMGSLGLRPKPKLARSLASGSTAAPRLLETNVESDAAGLKEDFLTHERTCSFLDLGFASAFCGLRSRLRASTKSQARFAACLPASPGRQFAGTRIPIRRTITRH